MMNLRLLRFALSIGMTLTSLVAFFISAPALAQIPELTYVFPAGGQAGTTVEVELIGKSLADVTELYFSRPGLKATSAGKEKMAITIPADAPPGDCDVWAVSPKGLSAPCRFVIGDMPEAVEKEPNDLPRTALAVGLPVVVNGRLTPGVDVDVYKVSLSHGTLILDCRSTSLGGKSWPTLTVIDPQGLELAHDTLTRLEPRLHLQIREMGDYLIRIEDRSYRQTTAPQYRLTMTQGPWLVSAFPPALQRAEPATGKMSLHKGQLRNATLYGFGLPGGKEVSPPRGYLQQLEVQVPAPEHGSLAGTPWPLTRALQVESFEYRHPSAHGSVRFELLDRAPLFANESSADRKSQEPLQVTPPVDLVGRFDTTRQVVDWYRFAAKANQVFWIEAVAERLDRPCDLEVTIYNKANNLLETLGDIVVPKGETATVPLETRDPAGSWKAPSDGEYTLAVRDLLNTPSLPGERSYRLSIGTRLEDFRLVAMLEDAVSPKGISVSPGKSVTVNLTAVRRGGHEGKIEVRAESLPAGLKIAPLTIGPKETSGKLVIEADKDAMPWVGSLNIVATSEVNRQPQTVTVQMATPLAGTTPAAARLCDEFVIAVIK